MISNCGHDERGKYSGGKAGDQTGTEWQVINWYNRPWKCVLRHPDLGKLSGQKHPLAGHLRQEYRPFGQLLYQQPDHGPGADDPGRGAYAGQPPGPALYPGRAAADG